MKADIWYQGREIEFWNLTSVNMFGSSICVDAAMTQVVFQTAKPSQYYAEQTWTSFGDAKLQ